MRQLSIWKVFVTILLLFITPIMATVYTRDQMLALRHSPVLLNHHSRSAVSYFGLHRRGCRAGAHWRQRVVAARGMTSRRTTPVEIPTVNNVRRAMVLNNKQLTSRQDDILRRLQPVHDSTMSSLSVGFGHLFQTALRLRNVTGTTHIVVCSPWSTRRRHYLLLVFGRLFQKHRHHHGRLNQRHQSCCQSLRTTSSHLYTLSSAGQTWPQRRNLNYYSLK